VRTRFCLKRFRTFARDTRQTTKKSDTKKPKNESPKGTQNREEPNQELQKSNRQFEEPNHTQTQEEPNQVRKPEKDGLSIAIRETIRTLLDTDTSKRTSGIRTSFGHTFTTFALVLFALVLLLITKYTENQSEPEATNTVDNTKMPPQEPSNGSKQSATADHASDQDQAGGNGTPMEKTFKLIAESLDKMGKGTPSFYANQLPPYPAENLSAFNGKDITAFLERYEDMAKYYNLPNKVKIDRITAHCKQRQRAIIQASEEYEKALEDEDWKTFREELKKRFRTNDKDQQESRSEYFLHWLLQCQGRKELNILEYLQEYQIRSKRCIEATTIEEDRRGFYLVKGLPLRHATKILEKFGLRTDEPKKFDYKKIRDYLSKRLEVEEEARMLNPSEAIKEIEQDEEFEIDPRNSQNVVKPAHVAVPPNTFQPATLHVPVYQDYREPKQSPPGTAPTRNEVEGLVDKMLNLKINKASLDLEPWKHQWTQREAELMGVQTIRQEVNRQAAEREKIVKGNSNQPMNQRYGQQNEYQTHGYQPQGENQQRRQYNEPQYPNTYRNNTQTYQQQQQPAQPQYNMNMNCFGCDKSGHNKNNCPTLRGLHDMGWIHMDDQAMIHWGTQNAPQGRVYNLGRRMWIDPIMAEIKRRWLKRDESPLTVRAPWVEQQTVTPVGNNAIAVQMMPDSAGEIPSSDYEQYWNLSSILAEEESDTKPKMEGHNQYNSSTIGAAVIGRSTPEARMKASHEPSHVQKTPRVILKREADNHVPHLRSHKNRGNDYLQTRKAKNDRTVQFVDQLDTEMTDGPTQKDDFPEKPSDKEKPYIRKHRMVEKLVPDSQKVIQRVLDEQIHLPLKMVLANMPDVRRKLFQTGYTLEEFERMEINTTDRDLDFSDQEDTMSNCAEDGTIVSSFSGRLPDYVLIEAQQGKIMECYSLGAEHWSDPEISHVQQQIEEDDQESSQELEYSELRDRQHEYDRPLGVEHLRRDCPKVPITIRKTTFLSLIDSGAELNTIKRETADRAMLPITSLPKSIRAARMVTANGAVEGFVGIVWGVPIRIGKIKVRTNFFVVESCTNSIILGNPFLTDARARLEYASNGLTYCRIFSTNGELNTRFVCARGNRINTPRESLIAATGNDRGVN
jgi:hypothetical protein